MLQVWRIFNRVAAGLLVCGVAGLAGLAAALSDWNWWSASSEERTALPNGAALPAALGQNASEEGQTDNAHGVVGLAIPQAGDKPPAAAFASPDNQPWYVPRLIVGTLPPDDVAVFNLTASPPASATLREWPLQPLSLSPRGAEALRSTSSAKCGLYGWGTSRISGCDESLESYCSTVAFYREVIEDPELPSPLKQPNAAFFHGRPRQRPDCIGKVMGESIGRQIACVVNPYAGIRLEQPIAELVDCLPFLISQSHNSSPG